MRGKERSLLIARKKLAVIARAERRLRNRLADIDWEENELLPAINDIETLVQSGQYPDLQVNDESILKRLEKAGGDARES